MTSHDDAERAAQAAQRRFGERIEVDPSTPGLDAIATLNERASCRDFLPERPPEALIRLLCATALAAPTKSDLQQADVVWVRDAGARAAIQALLPLSPWAANAPVLLVVCGDGLRLARIFEQRGAAFPNDHLDAFFNAAVDGAIVLSALAQAAELAGLGSCPISEIRNEAAAVGELLGLPERVFPVAGLALGYPRAKGPCSPRLALSATLHVDRFQTARVDEELDAYDARRVRELPYRREREPERFGPVQRYGWSEDKFRQYSERQREGFGAFVRGKGFRLD